MSHDFAKRKTSAERHVCIVNRKRKICEFLAKIYLTLYLTHTRMNYEVDMKTGAKSTDKSVNQAFSDRETLRL